MQRRRADAGEAAEHAQMHGDDEGPPGWRDLDICYPNTTNDAGDPVRVRLQQPYKFFFINSFRITLTAKATMRLEQPATLSKIVPDNGGACT